MFLLEHINFSYGSDESKKNMHQKINEYSVVNFSDSWLVNMAATFVWVQYFLSNWRS